MFSNRELKVGDILASKNSQGTDLYIYLGRYKGLDAPQIPKHLYMFIGTEDLFRYQTNNLESSVIIKHIESNDYFMFLSLYGHGYLTKSKKRFDRKVVSINIEEFSESFRYKMQTAFRLLRVS